MSDGEKAPGLREQKKGEVRQRIADALISLLTEGRMDISHDLIAERTGIARRTVYRYFPDREALLAIASDRVRELAGPRVGFPKTEEELLGTLHDIYTGFDRIAPIATLVRSTPQGRAMRRSQNDQRRASYTVAVADAVKELSAEDRVLATAMLQVLHTTPWLEMRDHWGLSGEQIARTTGWAIRTLLADLRARGSASLE
jgi:AcrR family transcriptional regulator